MKIVTGADMVAMEQATDAAGFGYDRMMAAAGGALARVIQDHAPFAGPILCLIGPGNNGGDGLVACARLQDAGAPAVPYIWRRKSGDDPLVAAVREAVWAEQDAGYTRLADLVAQAAIIVDALLGTGNTRPIEGSLAGLLVSVRAGLDRRRQEQPVIVDPAWPQGRERALPTVVACDCPSGLNCDTGAIDPLTLAAGVTVTFALPKVGHFLQPGASACGALSVADIHIDRDLAPASAPDLLTPAEVAGLLPARPASGHKGTFGKALIVAGSTNYPGAAAIACLGAYRAGAGLVHLATSAGVGQLVAGQFPEPVHTVLPAAMGSLTTSGVPILVPLLADHEALLVGPGLGTDPATVELIAALLLGQGAAKRRGGILFASDTEAPRLTLPALVVDADGLNALGKLAGGPAGLPPYSLVTPHPGEMARLTGLSTREVNANRWQVARRFAAAWNQIVVLKGAFTAIAHPDGRLAISPFADAALATAGSGDVLAGVLVALLAQGADPWSAARAGVYLHALAGKLAAADLGPALLATDIAHHLPQALARLHAV